MLYVALASLHVEYYVQLKTCHYRNDIELFKCVQRRASKLGKGEENMKEWLGELRLFSLRSPLSLLFALFTYLQGGCSEDDLGHLSQITNERM